MVSGLVTPPPQPQIKTPGAPRLGGFKDDYEPYSPRKSSRISSQKVKSNAQIPSPELPNAYHRVSEMPSPASRKKATSTDIVIDCDSPPPTLPKMRIPSISATRGGRSVSGALTGESTASAAEALGLSPKKGDDRKTSHHPSTAYRDGSMLPTPVKTPQKSPKKPSEAISTIARKLFERPASIDDAMPTPKKSGNTYSTLGLNGYNSMDNAPIEIYTDWSARIPEADLSPDNPFYGPGMASHDPVKKSTNNGKVTVEGEGEIRAEDAYKREDGLVYTFRGKKIFRKFTELEKDLDAEAGHDRVDSPGGEELDATVPARLRGPVTRSSLKPRLLFPTPEQIAAKQKKLQVSDDEEVMTDLEDPFAIVSTAAKHLNDFAVTPKAPKFAPVSPPTTARPTRNSKMDIDSSDPLDPVSPSARVTRSSKMEVDSSVTSKPITPTPRATRSSKTDPGTSAPPANPVTPPNRPRGDKNGSFDNWQHTKTISPVHARKREGELITRSGGDISKRRRGGRTSAI